MDGHFEASLTKKQAYRRNEKEYTTKRIQCTSIFCTIGCTVNCDWCGVARVTIDILPDVALLEIFDFYVNAEQFQYRDFRGRVEAWHTLVHVCRKWRNIIIGSPHRLDLRLYCDERTPVRETLDFWPPLPIVVWNNDYRKLGMDNIIAALEHNDRICSLHLYCIPSSQSEKVLVAIQQPFPTLTRLRLQFSDETASVIPASFLGGSAPGLQSLHLVRILFPGLPKLLLSSTNLVDLNLTRIPHSGYISPKALVTCLSVLTRLKYLEIGFRSPRSRPDGNSQRPPPQARTLFPVLTRLCFRGVSEYLEDLVARVDAPLLDYLDTMFFYQLIFDTPQLTQFISRTPKFKVHDEARLIFTTDWDVSVVVPQASYGALKLGILCSQSDWQLSSVAQVCHSSSPQALIPVVERLYILEDATWAWPWGLRWKDDTENSQWLELLHPFTTVKGLYISQEFVPRIAPALQELVGERVTEVLPALETLFLEGPLEAEPVQEAIERFVATRQLVSHPIAISRWERE
jgi:hypothetical protein